MRCLALLLLLLLGSVCLSRQVEDLIERFPGTFVFISGWPQSGTSLLNEMLTLTPGVSTQVRRCENRHGARCKNWNNEGQWLLDRSALNRNYMHPGAICPSRNLSSTDTEFSVFRDGCIEKWKSYWDIDRAFIVSEKSPQSIVKIPLYMAIFQKAQRVKFLVIVKHPASLNIAVMRGKGWLHSYEAVKKRTKSSADKDNYQEVEKVRNAVPTMIDNLQHFVQFMLKGFEQPVYRDKEYCELGWLAGMQSFQTDLAHIYQQRALHRNSSASDNSTAHHMDVKVMRFESFETPFETCKDVFAYLFDKSVTSSQNPDYRDDRDGNRYRTSRLTVKRVKDKYYHKAVENVCSLYFVTNGDATESDRQRGERTMKAAENMVAKRTSALRKRIANNVFINSGANKNHRQLRLQNQMPEDVYFGKKLNFHISSVNKVVERVREMKAVMQHTEVQKQLRTNASLASMMTDLRRIDTALRPYGYSIAPVLDNGPNRKRYFLKTSVLDEYMLPGLLQRPYRII